MLDCINQIPQIFERCRELNLAGFALTDHETVAGHIKALQYLKSKREKATQKFEQSKTEEEKAKNKIEKEYWDNFKLVLGNEIYLTRNGLNKENFVKGTDKYFHFILLAKDAEGHKQLRELSSRAWKRSFRQFIERVPTYYKDIEEVIGTNPGHVVGSSACLGSKFANLVMNYLTNGETAEALQRIDRFVSWCQTQFGIDDYYIELQPSESDEQNKYNAFALAYAKQHNIKAIITTDAHYIRREDRPIHKSYLNSGEGDRETDAFYSGTYLQSLSDIEGYMYNIDEKDIFKMLENTLEIGAKITEYDLHHQEIVPKVKLSVKREYPQELNKLIENKDYIQKFLQSSSEQDNYYIKSILQGLVRKIPSNLWEKYIAQIELEVAEVWEITQKIGNELSSYFNTMAKVVELMWTKGDSLVGVSRGSAGGFVSNYLLDITQMDPIQYGIEKMYWRFIHRDRPELPKPVIHWATIKVCEPA